MIVVQSHCQTRKWRLPLSSNTTSTTNNNNSKKKGKGKCNNNALRMVRLGHPARIKSSIIDYSLEALVQNHEGTEIVQDVRQELQSFLKILTNPKSRGTDKRLAYKEIKSLRKEVRTREEKVVQDLVSERDQILVKKLDKERRIFGFHEKFDKDVLYWIGYTIRLGYKHLLIK